MQCKWDEWWLCNIINMVKGWYNDSALELKCICLIVCMLNSLQFFYSKSDIYCFGLVLLNLWKFYSYGNSKILISFLFEATKCIDAIKKIQFTK